MNGIDLDILRWIYHYIVNEYLIKWEEVKYRAKKGFSAIDVEKSGQQHIKRQTFYNAMHKRKIKKEFKTLLSDLKP